MFILYGTVDGSEMGKPRPIPVAVYLDNDSNGQMALVNNLYLSRIRILSDSAFSVSSRSGTIPEGINDKYISASGLSTVCLVETSRSLSGFWVNIFPTIDKSRLYVRK